MPLPLLLIPVLGAVAGGLAKDALADAVGGVIGSASDVIGEWLQGPDDDEEDDEGDYE
jgi:hypothetical protein